MSIKKKPLRTWGEMSEPKKGEILLGLHYGHIVEWSAGGEFWTEINPESVVLGEFQFIDRLYYRVVKKTPSKHVMSLFINSRTGYISSLLMTTSTHKISYDEVDDEPVLTSVRMEKLDAS